MQCRALYLLVSCCKQPLEVEQAQRVCVLRSRLVRIGLQIFSIPSQHCNHYSPLPAAPWRHQSSSKAQQSQQQRQRQLSRQGPESRATDCRADTPWGQGNGSLHTRFPRHQVSPTTLAYLLLNSTLNSNGGGGGSTISPQQKTKNDRAWSTRQPTRAMHGFLLTTLVLWASEEPCPMPLPSWVSEEEDISQSDQRWKRRKLVSPPWGRLDARHQAHLLSTTGCLCVLHA